MDQNPPITVQEMTFLLSKISSAVVDGSEKRNGWLNFELQSPHVIERQKSNWSTVLK